MTALLLGQLWSQFIAGQSGVAINVSTVVLPFIFYSSVDFISKLIGASKKDDIVKQSMSAAKRKKTKLLRKRSRATL